MGPNALIALTLGVLVLALPRRHAFGVLLAASTCTTFGDSVEIATLNFYSVRVVIVFTLIRIMVRGELKGVRFHAFDALFLAWLMLTSLLYVAVDGRYVNFIERLGYLFDVGGLYIPVRVLIRSVDDLAETVAVLALLLIPLAVLMGFERATGRNLFAVLGGVPEWSQVRNGTVRCQGPFGHSILAGTFGAASFALMVGLSVVQPHRRTLAVVATLSAAVVVYTSGSSGPLSALVISIIGLGMWRIRAQMRVVRWAMLGGVIMFTMVMKAPIWFLIARLSDLTGGEGWYRSKLIDSAVNHFSEWWLIGTGYTAHWMETGISSNPYSADIVNEFVNQGIRGGLLCLVLFVAILCRSFSAMGTAANAVSTPLHQRYFFWTVGCSLAAHVASFFSVSYFDQTISAYYLVIGCTVMAATVRNDRGKEAPVPEPIGGALPRPGWRRGKPPTAGMLVER
jgi:hypothetical protein